MAAKLNIGDRFPRLALQGVDSDTINLPDPSGSKYQIVLFYRGHW